MFLIHSILSRLVGMERSNIGLLKSFGYRNVAIGWHYAQFSLAFSVVGIAIGISLGIVVGQYMTGVYREVYHFPTLDFRADALTYGGAAAVGLLAGLLGAFSAVRRATALAPIVALSPPTPTSFRKLSGRVEQRLASLSLRSRMVVRRLIQFPRRSAMTILGIALALALLIMSEHFPIAINRLLELNFGTAQRMHTTLTFADQRNETALREIKGLPGVIMAEPMRVADVFFSNGHRREREVIIGLPQNAMLNRLVESNGSIVVPDKTGLTLSASLARKLDVEAGDRVFVEATDGLRVTTQVTVSKVASPFLGGSAYMDQTELGRLLREPGRINGAYLIIDPEQRQPLNARFKQIPSIVGVAYTDRFQSELQKLFREGVGFFSNMFLFFSLSMAAGVAFSAARITISEQERDLATLRVLGYDRKAISILPLAEMTVLLVVAIPTGLLLGAALSNWMMHQFETDLFSFPLIFDRGAYAQSTLFVTVAVLLATVWARRDMNKIQLVAALKSHE
jgi:putative ABC transport system permease protein